MPCPPKREWRGKKVNVRPEQDVEWPPVPPILMPPTPESRGARSFQKSNFLWLIPVCVVVVLSCWFIFSILRKRWLERSNRSSRSDSILIEVRSDFVDEEQGPTIDHPIWFIRTEGLQQSVIESITLLKYKKDEGLIEGTDCSVCLGEFEEDDSLRLLPKCSHAFHVSCIDTWLRSHKNCPLCRAPIVSGAGRVQATAVEPQINDSGPSGETQLENPASHGGVESHPDEEAGAGEMAIANGRFGPSPGDNRRDTEIWSRNPPPGCEFNQPNLRVKSDLAENRMGVEKQVQPGRRSVSLDLSPAQLIYQAAANIIPDQGSSGAWLVNEKASSFKVASKHGSGSTCISKLAKSTSIRVVRMSMKRSLSSSTRFFSSRRCRTQSLG